MATTEQFCTFYLNGRFFGLPVQQVQEVIRYQEITRVPLVPEVIRGLINLRGQIVLAVDLRQRLGMEGRPASELPMNVVVRTDEGAISLLVDEIGDVLEVAEDGFEPPPGNVPSELREMILGVHKLEQKLLHVLNTAKACQIS
ncbi:MAG TPA: chemotaxis protein CheW [Candidatus Sulfotelmatobacter sp.]|jgi:purine-binding chemotaxis protein CheW